MDNYEIEEGRILVRSKKGEVRPVQTPEGFSDFAFRTTIAGIYTYFTANGRVPTVDDLYHEYPQFPRGTYAAIFLTSELKEALSYRGIAWDDEAGLSLEQHSALMVLSNPGDKRSLAAKLKTLGVPMARYQAWLRNPLFKQHLNKQTKDAYSDFLPTMRTALVGNAMDGDQRAIELVFAITGEYNPNAQGVQDARAVVMTVIESVIKHTINHPELRQSILADVQASVVAFDVMNQKTLEA